MILAAFPEMLGEGLLLLRRLKRYKDLYNAIDKTIGILDRGNDDEIMNIEDATADSLFPYLLSVAMLKQLQKMGVLGDLSDELASDVSLDVAIDVVAAPKTGTPIETVVLTLTALGERASEDFPDLGERLTQHINTLSSAGTIDDPIITLINSMNGRLPHIHSSVIAELGVSDSDWHAIAGILAAPEVQTEWSQQWSKLIGASVLKTHTGFRYIIDGCFRHDYSGPSTVRVTQGSDSIGLSLSLLTPVKPTVTGYRPMYVDRNITQEMIRFTSSEITEQKGFVRTTSGPDWIPRNRAVVGKDEKNQPTVTLADAKQLYDSGKYLTQKVIALKRLVNIRHLRKANKP